MLIKENVFPNNQLSHQILASLGNSISREFGENGPIYPGSATLVIIYLGLHVHFCFLVATFFIPEPYFLILWCEIVWCENTEPMWNAFCPKLASLLLGILILYYFLQTCKRANMNSVSISNFVM